jgi:hypothetical protein
VFVICDDALFEIFKMPTAIFLRQLKTECVGEGVAMLFSNAT